MPAGTSRPAAAASAAGCAPAAPVTSPARQARRRARAAPWALSARRRAREVTGAPRLLRQVRGHAQRGGGVLRVPPRPRQPHRPRRRSCWWWRRRAPAAGGAEGGADGDADGIEADEDEEIETCTSGVQFAPRDVRRVENATACTPCPRARLSVPKAPPSAAVRRVRRARSRPSPHGRGLPAPGTPPRPRARRRARRAPLVVNDVFGSFNATGCEACVRDRSATSRYRNCTACFPGTFSAASPAGVRAASRGHAPGSATPRI